MAINPIQFLLADNATATNGSNIITIQGTTTANTNASSVFSGSAVFIGNNQVVEGISGTAFDPATNTSTITLRNNWPHPTVTGRLVVFNTIEGLADAINRARDSARGSAEIQSIFGEVLTSTDMTIDVTINGVVTEITPYGYLEAQTTALIAEAQQVVDDITAVEGRVTVVENELTTIEGTLNGLVTSAQTAEASALTSATNSQNAATVSQSNANYVGDWSTLPDGNPRIGALNVPASVRHNNDLWLLTVNLADVTLSEPSSSNTDWLILSGDSFQIINTADIQGSIDNAGSNAVHYLPKGTYDVTESVKIDGTNRNLVNVSIIGEGALRLADNVQRQNVIESVSGENFTVKDITIQHNADRGGFFSRHAPQAGITSNSGATVDGATSSGATAINISATSLVGSVGGGNTFVISGDTTNYTVTNNVTASSNSMIGITFTPALSSNAADGAQVSVGQALLYKSKASALTGASSLDFDALRVNVNQPPFPLTQMYVGEQFQFMRRSGSSLNNYEVDPTHNTVYTITNNVPMVAGGIGEGVFKCGNITVINQ